MGRVEVRGGSEDAGTRAGEGGEKEGIEGGRTVSGWEERGGSTGWEGSAEGTKEGGAKRGRWEVDEKMPRQRLMFTLSSI